ncbi:hypothetical protein AAC387_Pa05g3030 [Persea americana]
MATPFQSFWGLFFSLSFYIIHSTSTNYVHIVYLGHNHAHDPLVTTEYHIQLLSTVFGSEDDAKKAMLYSYKHSFSGFAARLNSTQATTLASMGGVISVFKSKTLRLHTTRSWDFMGLTLNDGEPRLAPLQWAYGGDIVIGIFDTGIWPESESFHEEPGMGPVPSSWKGTCVKGELFNPTKACNRKLIGARYYVKGFEHDYGPLESEYCSPRDRLGHGTHTASTAVGSIRKNASFFGLGLGTARGGAPRARLAAYKVCWSDNLIARCTEADILMAYDDAISDGVHVISASLGMTPPLLSFFSSSSDIGSFHAVQMGVSVIFSAGNDGPDPSTVQNVAPWGTCVAGSTIDRMFPTQILLGNNISMMGEGFVVEQMNMRLADSSRYFNNNGVCELDNWNGKAATGRIVICFSTIGPQLSGSAALAVFNANGSGMIYAAPITKQFAEVDLIPTIYVNLDQGTQIQDYALSQTKRKTVQIFPSRTTIGRSPAPSVAYFSSRGPSSRSPNFLKPDISAPGVNILAAWPSKIPPTTFPVDFRSVNWSFESGTSMSCPHVSGIVALIKSAHRDWSPAAIKSAMMTTAYTRDTSLDNILAGGTMKAADPLDIGAGHVDPLKAIDPGLVYDMDAQDHILFLCSIGYTNDQISKMVLPSPKIDIDCPKGSKIDLDLNLNYPAIVISNLRCTITIKRTLRNVGQSRAIYFVNVVSPDGVGIVIWPKVLFFSWHKEKISYYVTLTPLKHSQGRYDFGEIVWSDGYHHVKSPLVVCVNNTGNVGHIETHPTS